MDEERDGRWRRWMTAAQSGDSAAYEKLLLELMPHVRRFVRRRLFDASAVEDVVQNVFISLHRARHTWRSERRFEPWLHAVARNAVTDHLRRRGRRAGREVSLEADGVPEPALEPTTPDDGLSQDLIRALEALPSAQRQAVSLLQLEGLSVAEAATRAGVTRSALKVRAHRGYRALRRKLEESDS